MDDVVSKAFLYAFQLHSGQFRKDGKPYIVHPFLVSEILAKNGASDALIAAGLLHDVIEDAHATPEVLEEKFGNEVTKYVLFDTEDKTLSWEDRKNRSLEALKQCDRECAMLVCADKLANISDMVSDLEVHGERAWDIFKRGKEKQEWLFREYLVVFEKLSDLQMYQELKEKVNFVFGENGAE